jgi:hypothetical protein
MMAVRRNQIDPDPDFSDHSDALEHGKQNPAGQATESARFTAQSLPSLSTSLQPWMEWVNV